MSSEAKYTPGPWAVAGFDVFAPSDKCVATTVADYNDTTPDEEMEANARLIAAAPELLEASKLIIHSYENADVVPDALNRAYAAVAKAEGKA